jgi:alkylation response protein AidB-like acyl-CoA dehydrogenase
LAEGKTDEAEVALRMAKAHGSAAFAFAGDRGVQFHGGFGFTYECDAQLYLRRALWCQYQFGDEAYHRHLLEPMLLDQAG